MDIKTYQSIEYCHKCGKNLPVIKHAIKQEFDNGVSVKLYFSMCKTCHFEFQSPDDRIMAKCDTTNYKENKNEYISGITDKC